MKLQVLEIGTPQSQIPHHLVRQINNLFKIHGSQRAETPHGGDVGRQCERAAHQAEDLHAPISQHGKRESIAVIKVVKLGVITEIEVKLARPKAVYGAADPRVDLGDVFVEVGE